MAGDDRTAGLGAQLVLDGRSSYDPDGDELNYDWLLIDKPALSTTTLSDPMAATPEITTDREGPYTFSLIVSDSRAASEPDVVTITVIDGVPVANAGPNQTVAHRSVVVLDGTGSFDLDGGTLAYHWTFATLPPGSAATLVEPGTPEPTFIPDVPGAYTIELVVDDGVLVAAPDRVTITATNVGPTVSAGVDRVVDLAEIVSLVASATDPEGDPLDVQWTLAERPSASTATPLTPTMLATTLTIDEPGLYRLVVTVSDGFVTVTDDVAVGTAPAVIEVPHGVVDAEYSRALDRILVASGDASEVALVDPATGDEVVVAAPVAPLSVSIAPGGLQAVVGHDGYVSVVDLSTASLTTVWPTTTIAVDVVHGGNGYAYLMPEGATWGAIHCVRLATGVETLGTGPVSTWTGSRIRLAPGQSAFYLAQRGLFPSDVEKYSIAGGTSAFVDDSPYHGEYETCGNLWLSEDGQRIFGACGDVFRASTTASVDMTYDGSLSNTQLVTYLDHSAAAHRVAAIPANDFPEIDEDTRVDVYDDGFLVFQSSTPLPEVFVGNEWVQAHGQFVFFDQSGTALYVIMRASSSAGIPATFLLRAF